MSGVFLSLNLCAVLPSIFAPPWGKGTSFLQFAIFKNTRRDIFFTNRKGRGYPYQREDQSEPSKFILCLRNKLHSEFEQSFLWS